MIDPRTAPDWHVAEWLNIDHPPVLADLRGRVVVALAFQLLCPGCVQHALPQLLRIRDSFAADDVAVFALHTVFEHHAAQGRRDVLEAFAHENRIRIPIGIDRTGGDAMPETFRAYSMQGTPTLILIDRQGKLRLQHFGHADDLRLGAAIAGLVAEPKVAVDAGPAAT